MKATILILCLICFTSASAQTPWWWYHKHKSETKIAKMTPAERVDELIEENFHHRWDVLDEQRDLIEKYILLDGTKALSQIIKRMNEYDPSRPHGDKETKYWRFEACYFLLNTMDIASFRLRASEEGRNAINALEHSTERMKVVGFVKEDNRGNSVFTSVKDEIEKQRGINGKDSATKETLRIKYKISLTEAEMLELSNFLTQHYPEYPSWSSFETYKDQMQLNSAGNPLQIGILKKPERYYEAYLEFKKTK